jgi:hypothetical protein
MAVLRRVVPLPLANGFASTSGVGKVSLYWQPRLNQTATLDSCGTWANWAASVGTMNPRFYTNLSVNPIPLGDVSIKSTPDSTVWTHLFNGATMGVEPWAAPDRSNTTFRSFGELDVAEAIMDLYTDVAISSPLAPPTVAQLLARPTAAGVLGGGGALATALQQAKTYQERVGAVPGSSDTAPQWEFHQAVSMLGRHPHLMRLLGLVVDYEIDLPAGAIDWIAVTSDYEIEDDPPAAINSVEEISVKVQIDSSTFRVLPIHSDVITSDGFMGLAGSSFGLSQIDVTAAIRRLAALAREVESPTSSGALPALSDAGISLLHKGRPARLNEQFADDRALEVLLVTNPDSRPDVKAEHVRVGYRVDVIKDGADPLSLFERNGGKYHFPRFPNPVNDEDTGDDEGWVGTSLNRDRRTSGQMVNRLPEAIARWRGWSLAAPPRGKVADAATGTAIPPSNHATGTDPVQLEVNYHVVPGTLPSLRYGSTYRFRARTVDIAGNSVPLSTPTPANRRTDPITYGRLDPLPAPVVVRKDVRSVPGVGDTTARVVIRSNYDTPYASIGQAERLVFPPSASQQTCERHGLPSGGVDEASYATLVARDGLDFTEHTAEDPASGEPYANGANSVTVGYLPDPAGPTLTLMNVPGITGGVVQADFAGAWPALSTRRLIVKGAAGGAPTVGAGGGPVTIMLPKAAQYELDLSVAPGIAYDDHFALWHELLDASPGNLDLLKSLVRDGRHWMFSSRARIRIVHAVRQPLTIPAFSALTATRPEVGSRSVTLAGTATLDRPSTGRTVLTGRWTDPVDDVTQPAPTTTSGALVVGTQKVLLDGSATSATVGLTLDFMDARRHTLLVRQEAWTRFARDFTEQRTLVVPASGTALLDSHGVLAASVLLKSTDGATTYVDGIDYTLDAAAGTVARKAGGALPSSSTGVVAQYVALPLTRMSDEVGAADRQVTIPNAKAPGALQVAAIVPSFTRVGGKTKKKLSVVHDPRTLRVYLERPWFDTGVGEQLAVVLDNGAPAVPSNTRFARDSLLKDGALPRPVGTHFPSGTARTSDGLPVVGHNVAYDASRRQWYSDVRVNAALGYRAFVQLALARYQPVAVTGAGLSRISRPDAVLVGALRAVTVKLSKKNVTVTVTGPEHSGRTVDGNGPLFNKVTVSVQGVDKDIADKELRWTERPLGSKEIDAKRKTRAANSVWTAKIKVKKIAKGKPIRLVITETEPMAAANGDGISERLVYVPVYTEVADLPKKWTKKIKKPKSP